MAVFEGESHATYQPVGSQPEPSPASGRLIFDYAVNGFIVARALHVIARLGVADVLKDVPKSVDDLAGEVGAHPPTLYRLLRALASVGVFNEVEPGKFGLTPAGSYLRGDVPGSMKPLAA